jgi:hypothetical protein
MMIDVLPPFVYLDIYGRRREFKLYDKSSTSWNNVPGLYVFVSPGTLLGGYGLKYVGQTISFRDRLPNHERWAEAQRLGARWVGALVETSAAERDRLEAEMIQRLQPPLNDQFKSPQQNALIGLLRRA